MNGRIRRLVFTGSMMLVAVAVIGALSGAVIRCLATKAPASSPISSTYVQHAVLVGPNIPANPPQWTFDLTLADPSSGQLFLSDCNNARVDVWNLQSGKYVTGIKAHFTGMRGIKAGYDQLGPGGLAVDNSEQLWAGNGDGTVKVLSTKTLKFIASVRTGAKMKADEIGIDLTDGVVMVSCPAEHHPFVCFINDQTHKLNGKLAIPGAVSIEQPVWSSVTGKFYVTVATKTRGQVDVIDPLTRQVVKVIGLGKCAPTGEVFGPGTDLLVGAGSGRPAIIDVASGKILARYAAVKGYGIDEVAYDSVAQRYLLADYAKIRVIDALTLKPLPTIADHDTWAHAVTVDSTTHLVYLPNARKGVVVYAPKSATP